MDAAAVRERLGLGEAFGPWLERLEQVGPPPVPLVLPDPPAAAASLAGLGVAPEDIAAVTASIPVPQRQPELWWLLERACHCLVRHLGEIETSLPWPALPEGMGDQGRLFNVHCFLAVLPALRAWHAAHGVPEAVSRETVGSLGRAMALHRRSRGTAGVFEQDWMTKPFRAVLYEVGRLQYTPFRLGPGAGGEHSWYQDPAVARFGTGFRSGDLVAGIHIPASGPLTPEGCRVSLTRAAELFAGPEPCGPCRVAICGSWLLDEQLAEYLPADANIVRFQRLFTMLPGAGNGDGSVFNFVFHRAQPPTLEGLPQNTRLERAIVAHLRAGRHWRTRTGWLAL